MLKGINMEGEIKISKHWINFFNKFKEIDTLKVSQWKEVHILSYICKRFKDTFGVDYSIEIKGAPGKSKNIFFIKNIYATLGTSDSRMVKDYIDWVYDGVIVPKKTRFRTINFFVNESFANDFKFYKKQKKVITRTTEIPKEYKDLCNTFNVEINTYGDLSFLLLSVEKGMDKSGNNNLLLQNLQAIGLDFNDLKEIK
jgi:hypothetical protein